MLQTLEPTARKGPWHLWTIGIAGLLWNVLGVVSFALTRLNVEAVMSRFPPQQRAYFAAFPVWTVASWAVGVFAGVAGCILLLRRIRTASRVLLLSMIGLTLTNVGGLLFLDGLRVMRETDGLGLTLFPVIVSSLLALYARAMEKAGVTR